MDTAPTGECVCVCVSTFIISAYFCLKSMLLNPLYIQASDLRPLSITWQPLASQSIIGWALHTNRSSFILRCEYLNRQHGVLHNTIKFLFYRWKIHIYCKAILLEMLAQNAKEGVRYLLTLIIPGFLLR